MIPTLMLWYVVFSAGFTHWHTDRHIGEKHPEKTTAAIFIVGLQHPVILSVMLYLCEDVRLNICLCDHYSQYISNHTRT